MSVALDLFCLTVVVTMTSAVEFYALITVGGGGKPSSWILMRRGTAVFPLLNNFPTYALAVDATTPVDWAI